MMALLLACPVCWGQVETPLTAGAKAGVAFLLAVIVSVLLAIALIARSWARRARELELAGKAGSLAGAQAPVAGR